MLNVQNYSYHSHTNFSDGKNTAPEMVRRAKEIGFSEIGITDHLIVHKNMRQSPSCAVNQYMMQEAHIYNVSFAEILESFQRHCEMLRQLSKTENFPIRIGFEVDFFTYNGWLEELDDFLARLDYDYVISGNHFVFDADCETVYNLTDLPKLSDDCGWYKEMLQEHFKVMKQAVESRRFKFLAHLDYARRLGDEICGPNDFWAEKTAVLDALAANNVPMEISTKGLRKIGNFYPSDNILLDAAKRNITMLISDDAHHVDELGKDFAAAEEKLQQYKIMQRLQF
jgi:histidinol-phosphatase (PHP family)